VFVKKIGTFINLSLLGTIAVRYQLQLGVYRVQGVLKVYRSLGRGQNVVLRLVRQRVRHVGGF
jgi:hypothetical protein